MWCVRSARPGRARTRVSFARRPTDARRARAHSHKHTTVALGRRINFLTGVNGSGKSAVLVAITVGLAGKANFTGRGASPRAASGNPCALCAL